MKNDPIVILTDTREQKPLDFSPYYGHGIASGTATVHTGDYTVEGYETSVCFERKSLDDLVGTLLNGYEANTRKPGKRFNRTLQRMSRYDVAIIIVESDIIAMWTHKYRSAVEPSSIWGMLLGIWATYGVPFIFTGSRAESARFIADFARHYVHARTKKFFLPEDAPVAAGETAEF